MKKKSFNAIVVGAGSIGATKPDKFDNMKSKNILTMAHAFAECKRTNLLAIVDIDDKKASMAATKWNAQYSASSWTKILECSPDTPIDIMAVCIPTEYHYEFFKSLRDVPKEKLPKIILAEKPFCENYTQSALIKNILDTLGIQVLVNYTRRYDETYTILKQNIDDGILGEIYNAVIYYDRGIQRDGCHAIDMCNYLFGKLQSLTTLARGRRVTDYTESDPTLSVHLAYELCKNVLLLPCDGRAYSIFETDITAERGRVKFVDHGLTMELYQIEDEKTYGAYGSLKSHPILFKTELNKSLLNYVNRAVDFLDGVSIEKNYATMNDALLQHIISEEIKEGDVCN